MEASVLHPYGTLCSPPVWNPLFSSRMEASVLHPYGTLCSPPVWNPLFSSRMEASVLQPYGGLCSPPVWNPLFSTRMEASVLQPYGGLCSPPVWRPLFSTRMEASLLHLDALPCVNERLFSGVMQQGLLRRTLATDSISVPPSGSSSPVLLTSVLIMSCLSSLIHPLNAASPPHVFLFPSHQRHRCRPV
ncbi:hypothetical protein EYF80_047766 [Liparis tanakae]|uniref:Uncharacterized protein n=1 Tax=Liparis tanakae TaxID=230148 RepID=A0A4Z2FLM1_9TELE|nr:hypothetical protein EYF80_047766 [Liparis tanakae]